MVKLTLIQGDCLKILPTIPDKSIDLVLTDPPYGINKEGITNDNDTSTFEKTLPEIYRILKDDSFFATFYSVGKLDEVFNFAKNVGFTYRWQFINYICNGVVRGGLGFSLYNCIIIFQKGDAKIKKQINDVFKYATSSQKRLEVNHPTPKHELPIGRVISCLTKENSLILDPFLGSGSTMLSCNMFNRNCIGIEIEPKYIEVCKKRLNWGSSLGDTEFEFKVIE